MSEAEGLLSIADASLTSVRAVAIVSLLGESALKNSATRMFHGRAVIAQVIDRIAGCEHVAATVVLAWDDQVDAVRAAIPQTDIRSIGVRKAGRAMLETNAALRWADGWRGALLGKTSFDRGFDANSVLAALDDTKCEAAVLVDAAGAIVESATLNTLISHISALPDQAYAFAPGAVGSGAMIVRRSALAALAKQQRGPGSLVTYHPDRPEHDPAAKSFAVVVPPRVARSPTRLVIDSDRAAKRLSLVQASGEAAIEALERSPALDEMPRELVLELTTRRATKPAWSMLASRTISRPDLSLGHAKSVFEQLGGIDDVRLTLAGVGDPLLHPQWQDLVRLARESGIRAIHIETDLLPDDADDVAALAGSGVDVVSFSLPAAYAVTYARLMGVDRMRDVLENVKRFLLTRNARNSGVPILVPTFVKCTANLGEMEAWYDQWIRAVGAAVIAPPSDYSGRIAYSGVADMTAGRRRPCRRLQSRMTILCDGSTASCEEDVLGEQSCAQAGSIRESWIDGLAMLRSLHDEHRWDESELCKSCRMWDRP